MVEHDSTIPPGREGTITPLVKLKGMRGGAFAKAITVESNAENEPRLTLRIKGYIVPIIEMKTRHVNLTNHASLADGPPIEFRSKKKNLNVMDAVFESSQSGKAGSFRRMLPILPTYRLSRAEKPGADGFYDYTLKLAVAAELTASVSGTFKLATNHPDKPEMTLRGRVNVQK